MSSLMEYSMQSIHPWNHKYALHINAHSMFSSYICALFFKLKKEDIGKNLGMNKEKIMKQKVMQYNLLNMYKNTI